MGMYGGKDNQTKETAQEGALAQVSAEQWNDYQRRFRPFENKFIEDVTMSRPGALENRQAIVDGQINADAAQARAAKPGGDPSRMGAIAPSTAPAAQAQVLGRQGVIDQRVAGENAVVSMGRGQKAEIIPSLAEVAGNAQRGALAATANRNEEDTATKKGVATGAGAIGRAYAGSSAERVDGNTYFPGYGYANPTGRTY